MVSVACCHYYSNMLHASCSGNVPRTGGLADAILWLAGLSACMCNTGRLTLRPSRGSCGSVGLAAEARARCRRFRLYAKKLERSRVPLVREYNKFMDNERCTSLSCTLRHIQLLSRRKPPEAADPARACDSETSGGRSCLLELELDAHARKEQQRLLGSCRAEPSLGLHPRAVMLGAPGPLATRGV